MKRRSEPPKPKLLGYLAVLRDESHRYFGGLLLIDRLGRPVEFHCTSPVIPSPAHRQLYGPTLEREVVAGQIAPALLRHAKHPLAALVTDRVELLEARRELDIPVILSLATSSDDEESAAEEGPQAGRRITELRLDVDAWIHEQHPADMSAFRRTWGAYAEHVALDEPLQRIHGALEAARQARAA